MRRILGFLGSLGVGVMLTAAGLLFDANTLIYSGIVIFALMVALWLWSWARPVTVEVPVQYSADPEPEPADSKGRALKALRSARDSAAMAKSYKSEDRARKAYHQIEAALLSIKREFGFGPLKITGAGTAIIPYLDVMVCYLAYIDRIYPLLKEGHVEEARAKAKAFKWTWGDD